MGWKEYIDAQSSSHFHELKRSTHFCVHCGKEYKRSSPYQITCSESCSKKDEEKIVKMNAKQLDKNCVQCGLKFRKTTESSCAVLCGACRRTNFLRCAESRQESPIEKWVNKKRKKGIPLEILIKRMEWKRVFGEHEWDHYLKGRKWDKI